MHTRAAGSLVRARPFLGDGSSDFDAIWKSRLVRIVLGLVVLGVVLGILGLATSLPCWPWVAALSPRRSRRGSDHRSRAVCLP